MSIEGFDIKEQWIGTDDISSYTFDFKIFELTDLYIYVQDQFGNIVAEFNGTNTDWLASVTFDSINGGGTINLLTPFNNAWVITAFLANDLPEQPAEFPNKFSFTMDAVEGALDYLGAALQRVAFLAQRSVRLHDLDDVTAFDMRLPMNLSTFPDGIVAVNHTGTGFQVTASFANLIETLNAAQAAALAAQAQAEASATAAASANTNAVASEAAAAAAAAQAQAILLLVQAAASGIGIHTGPFASIAPNANLNLPGEVTSSATYTMVDFTARIKRGTTVYAKQNFTIFFRNGAWEIATGPDLYADAGNDHGVTFTVNAVTAQINAAVANDGGSNAVIDLIKTNWAV